MMLQPGDKVWVGPLTLDEHGEAEWYDGDDERLAHDQSAIPDIPNINTICRFLAEHPETVDALECQMHQSFGLGGETKSSQLAVGFLKAMRGEGGQ